MTTRRARSGRPRARRAARARRPGGRARRRGARCRWSRAAAGGTGGRAWRQGVEDVALRRLVAGAGHEVADVARRHAERVGHDRRQVRRRLAVEDPGQGPGEEAVRAVVEAELRADEQELGRACAGGRRARPRSGRPPCARRGRRRCPLRGRRPTDGPGAPARARRARATRPASAAQASRRAASRSPGLGGRRRARAWRRSARGRAG